MRYLTVILLLLLNGCGGTLRKADQAPGSVEVKGITMDIPPGVDPTLMQQLASELELQLAGRQPTAAPIEHMAPDVEVDGEDMWVWWEYGVSGDYDQNGEVNLADISPIAIDFQASESNGDWDNHRMADGDVNGEINLADISPIAVNFTDTFGEYILESAPGPMGPWTVVGRYSLGDGALPAGGGLLEFDILVPGGAALVYQYIWTETTGGGPMTRLDRFNTISHFMYQIQELDAPGAVDALAATHYDLLVLEPTNTNQGQESFDTAAAVAQLKASPDSRGGNKLVIAYIDIGEAEDYRTYWDSGWTAPANRDTPGTPDWLVTIDPDGWSGNYPVAFWRSEWEDIVIYNSDSLLNNAIDSGFEGIYMDWVEGYDDLKVDDVAQAEVPPVNTADAMVEFIGKIRTAARLRDPEFLVIQQNAPYLIDHATSEAAWLAVIDGIAFEDTWFSGAGDGVWNDPGSGDTPNDDTEEYSTANRIIQNQRLLGLGVPVWTVDYCLPFPPKLALPENFPQVYTDSNAAGFIPLCTQVGLEKITTTPPPWY